MDIDKTTLEKEQAAFSRQILDLQRLLVEKDKEIESLRNDLRKTGKRLLEKEAVVTIKASKGVKIEIDQIEIDQN